MKNRRFTLILIALIVLMILTLTLNFVFKEQGESFGLSGGMYFLAVFCLFAYKNALKPTEDFGPYNSTKDYYEKKGDLNTYKALCHVLLILTIAVGTLCLLGGFGGLMIHYIKTLFPKESVI